MGIEIGIGIGSEFDLTTVVERDKNQPSSDSYVSNIREKLIVLRPFK